MKNIDTYMNEAFRLRDDTRLNEPDERVTDAIENNLQFFMKDCYRRRRDALTSLSSVSRYVGLKGETLTEQQRIIDECVEKIMKKCRDIYTYITMQDTDAYKIYVLKFIDEIEDDKIKHEVLFDGVNKLNGIKIVVTHYESSKYEMLLTVLDDGFMSQVIIGKK